MSNVNSNNSPLFSFILLIYVCHNDIAYYFNRKFMIINFYKQKLIINYIIELRFIWDRHLRLYYFTLNF